LFYTFSDLLRQYLLAMFIGWAWIVVAVWPGLRSGGGCAR
jgi:hypothetical protein